MASQRIDVVPFLNPEMRPGVTPSVLAVSWVNVIPKKMSLPWYISTRLVVFGST
jgi:hypothetical protein